jgi:hypothetical protein
VKYITKLYNVVIKPLLWFFYTFWITCNGHDDLRFVLRPTVVTAVHYSIRTSCVDMYFQSLRYIFFGEVYDAVFLVTYTSYCCFIAINFRLSFEILTQFVYSATSVEFTSKFSRLYYRCRCFFFLIGIGVCVCVCVCLCVQLLKYACYTTYNSRMIKLNDCASF